MEIARGAMTEQVMLGAMLLGAVLRVSMLGAVPQVSMIWAAMLEAIPLRCCFPSVVQTR